VRFSIRPIRRLRAMEKLDRIASASPFAARRADLVTAVQPVKYQFSGVRRGDRRADNFRAVLIKPLGHAEQVGGRFIEVGQDEVGGVNTAR
jgi:hypothetical protein